MYVNVLSVTGLVRVICDICSAKQPLVLLRLTSHSTDNENKHTLVINNKIKVSVHMLRIYRRSNGN